MPNPYDRFDAGDFGEIDESGYLRELEQAARAVAEAEFTSERVTAVRRLRQVLGYDDVVASWTGGPLMGWGYGVNQEGREVGYTVEATCDSANCAEKIDRGLAYVCGGMHDGDEHGCGRYFCGKHLAWWFRDRIPSDPVDSDHPDDEEQVSTQLCQQCGERWERREGDVGAFRGNDRDA